MDIDISRITEAHPLNIRLTKAPMLLCMLSMTNSFMFKGTIRIPIYMLKNKK